MEIYMKKIIYPATGILLILTLCHAAAATQLSLNQKEYLFYNVAAFIFFSIGGIIAQNIIAYVFFIKNSIDVGNIKYVIIANIITFPLYYFGDYLVKDYFIIILNNNLLYVMYYVTGAILIIFFESYFLYYFCKRQLKYQSFLFLSIIMNSLSLLIGTAASFLGTLFL